MKHKISLSKVSAFAVVSIALLLTGCGAPKDWTVEKNKVKDYLEERYPDDTFTFEAPKRTFDTDGTGKLDEYTYVVKTKSKNYPEFGIFPIKISELGNETFIYDSYQSMKFSTILGRKMKEDIDIDNYLYVGCFESNIFKGKVYDDYEEYFKSKYLTDLTIYLAVKEKDLDKIKDVLDTVASDAYFAGGKIELIAISKSNYHFLNTYDFVIWWDDVYSKNVNPDVAYVPYSDGKIDYENIEFDRFVDNDSKLKQALSD